MWPPAGRWEIFRTQKLGISKPFAVHFHEKVTMKVNGKRLGRVGKSIPDGPPEPNVGPDAFHSQTSEIPFPKSTKTNRFPFPNV